MKSINIIINLFLFSCAYTQTVGVNNNNGATDDWQLILKITLSTVFGFLFIVLLIYCFCWRRRARILQQRYNQYFQTERSKRNRICLTNLREQLFQKERNIFLNTSWDFYFNLKQRILQVKKFKMEMRKFQQLCYQVQLSGRDEMGKWTGIGYYFNSEDGIQFWFKKDYLEKEIAQQVGDKDKIYFEGKLTNQRNYEGTWYYQGFEHNSEFSGKWYMKRPKQIPISDISTTNIYH